MLYLVRSALFLELGVEAFCWNVGDSLDDCAYLLGVSWLYLNMFSLGRAPGNSKALTCCFVDGTYTHMVFFLNSLAQVVSSIVLNTQA